MTILSNRPYASPPLVGLLGGKRTTYLLKVIVLRAVRGRMGQDDEASRADFCQLAPAGPTTNRVLAISDQVPLSDVPMNATALGAAARIASRSSDTRSGRNWRRYASLDRSAGTSIIEE